MNNLMKTLLMLSILWITSCSSSKPITFSNEKWSFSGVVGDIINSDSTLRFSFGDHALNPAMTLISCADSLSIHKDARKYITRILKVCGLENSTVYFYAPLENTMWVELPKNLCFIFVPTDGHITPDMDRETVVIWEGVGAC